MFGGISAPPQSEIAKTGWSNCPSTVFRVRARLYVVTDIAYLAGLMVRDPALRICSGRVVISGNFDCALIGKCPPTFGQ